VRELAAAWCGNATSCGALWPWDGTKADSGCREYGKWVVQYESKPGRRPFDRGWGLEAAASLGSGQDHGWPASGKGRFCGYCRRLRDGGSTASNNGGKSVAEPAGGSGVEAVRAG
jgi:hypothetical protein